MHIMNMEHTNLYFHFGWTHFSYVSLLPHAEPLNSYPDINMMHMSFKETRFIISCIQTNTIQILKRVISIQWNETVKKNLKKSCKGSQSQPMPLSYLRWRMQNLFKRCVSLQVRYCTHRDVSYGCIICIHISDVNKIIVNI
jgi:hypothetical protein